jgi:integrase
MSAIEVCVCVKQIRETKGDCAQEGAKRQKNGGAAAECVRVRVEITGGRGEFKCATYGEGGSEPVCECTNSDAAERGLRFPARAVMMTGAEITVAEAGLVERAESAKAKITLDTIAARYFEATKRRVSAPRMRARYEAHIKPVLGAKEANAVTRADLIALYNAKRGENLRAGRHIAALTRLKKAAKKAERAERLEIKGKIAKKERLIAAIDASEGDGYSRAFCRSLIDLIGTAYSFELADEKPLVYRNPISGLYKTHPEIAKLNNEKERTFTKREAKWILEAAKTRGFTWRFTLLAVTTGARRGALLRLRRKDVDLEAETVRLIDEKAESGDARKKAIYTIPLCSYTRQALCSFLEGLEPNDLVVWGEHRTQKNSVPSAQMINYYMQPVIDEAVTGNRRARRNARLTLHAFRSFAITAALDCGCPEFLARRFSNHSTGRRSAFDRYAKANVEQMRPYLERAMAFLEEK